MKLRVKILPKYFEQIKAGTKTFDYRQIESIIFVNTETGEEIKCEVWGIKVLSSWEYADVFSNYPDIEFTEHKRIYKIMLGRMRD